MTTDPCLVGVNLPWLFGAYGHDLATTEMHPDWGHDFDAFRAYRPLVEAQVARRQGRPPDYGKHYYPGSV